jgi:hypothetical protein
MKDFVDPYFIFSPILVEICCCGHALKSHTLSACEGSRGTCRCMKIHPLLAVENASSFSNPHSSVGVGHALIQGILSHPAGAAEIQLSKRDLGKRPECYRCGRLTHALMPVLVNRHSVKAVSDVSRGRMTRLWCSECCELEEVPYSPILSEVIRAALNRSRL